MVDAMIFDAIRTPRGKGKKSGSLHEVKPVDLLATLMRELPERLSMPTNLVGDVILGCVTQTFEQGADIARTAVLHSGWDPSVPGVTLNRFCASGLEAVNMAAMKVQSGSEDVVVAGGVESMSRVPMGADAGAMVMDPAVNAGLGFIPQGVSADLIATLEGFTRTDLDTYAVRSQTRAGQARGAGHFSGSLVGVRDANGLMILDHDETIRENTTIDDLAKLNPSFAMMGEMGFDATAMGKYPQVQRVEHLHHAGNSSGIVDGAALVVVGSPSLASQLGLAPRARIRSCAAVGTEPTIMLTGPAPATRKAVQKAGLALDDIDLFEINEAFAAVVLKTVRDLGIDMENVNVNGGAIAMGHPLGATGAVLLGTLMDELERRRQTVWCRDALCRWWDGHRYGDRAGLRRVRNECEIRERRSKYRDPDL